MVEFPEEKYDMETMMMIEDGGKKIVEGEQPPIDVFTLLSNGGKRDFLIRCDIGTSGIVGFHCW